ncbi:MAG TPA: serine/threonine-protein kinase [Streptosporangiaceae bacterium]|jgi:predicted Ser/Thr protein kinase
MPTEPLGADDPRQVGSYRIDARLGAGGMGQVFLGRSPGGRRVAVKVVRPEFAGDPTFRARFAAEVAAARKVGGFHTAQVVDADTSAASPWLVTAYIPGRSLIEAVRADGPLDTAGLRTLGAGLAEGLAAIHRHGLVHRDLKPGNVIMAEDGPRIIDFGIARAADATAHTTVGVAIGTYAYMSPEQIRAEAGAPAGPASDVFALGCVLAYAATGRTPFQAASIPALVHRVLNEPPDLGGVPSALLPLVGACLEKDPADRPGVAAVLAELSGVPAATVVGPPEPTRAADPSAPAPRAQTPAELTGVYLGIAALPAFFFLPVLSYGPGRGVTGFALAKDNPWVFAVVIGAGLLVLTEAGRKRAHPFTAPLCVLPLGIGLPFAFFVPYERFADGLSTVAPSTAAMAPGGWICVSAAMAAVPLAFDGMNRWMAGRMGPPGAGLKLGMTLLAVGEIMVAVAGWLLPIPWAYRVLAGDVGTGDSPWAVLAVVALGVAVFGPIVSVVGAYAAVRGPVSAAAAPGRK